MMARRARKTLSLDGCIPGSVFSAVEMAICESAVVIILFHGSLPHDRLETH
jgi:hypothetical protein